MTHAAVIVFPGSNCDRDAAQALQEAYGRPALRVWHTEATLPPQVDLVVLPGGFSYGDYLRCGAMAAQSPIMADVRRFAQRGGRVLGICNGFQILCESGLLPGVLLRNRDLRFICRVVELHSAGALKGLGNIALTIAHAEGNYFADADTLEGLEQTDKVALRYQQNPNGAQRDIAGIFNTHGNVLGMMPHPERHPGMLYQIVQAWAG
ncbi:MAG: phosphoribosylformylglycinamidine synthase subunit PurQ [Holosporales bacterium]|jgi:phosphoribosylformylglycinamidine synthase I